MYPADKVGDSHNGLDIGKFLIGCDSDGLDEELVSALDIQRRILFHRLQKNCGETISTKTIP